MKTAIGDPTATFRDGQWEAIDALVNHRRKLLVVQRTGWGKSSVYFISTRILRDQGFGPTIIISPLLALMRNLDGVFEIHGEVRHTPVFLIDAVVDSGWTLTIIAALLRQACSGAVFPLALATTAIG